MKLIPIKELLEDNAVFSGNPLCQESIYMSVDFYKKVGFTPPWICYLAEQNNELVGAAGFKGKPLNGAVEIAYSTFEKFQHQGIGTLICQCLVDLSICSVPAVRITARTLPENNYSTRILEKNKFKCLGLVQDPEDGPVWEWVYDQPVG